MKKFLFLCFVFINVNTFGLLAQRTITGMVKDADSKEALIGASILVKGTTNGVVTDANGLFSLSNVPTDAKTLEITFVGYSTLTLDLTSSTIYDIALSSGTELDNVVVIGSRNQTRTKLQTASPVDVIPIKDVVNNIGQVDLNQILTYVAPSFQSTRQTISDGSDHIDPAQLRGLGPDQVLVLVNGKRRHQYALVNVNGTVNRGTVGTDLNAIPATCIERIEILRDGAAAQYGSDAIAGVINIVLKRSLGLTGNVSGGANVTSYQKYYAINRVNPSASPSSTNDYTNVTDGQTYQAGLNYGIAIGSKGYLNVTGEYTYRDQSNRTGVYTGQVWPSVGGVDKSDSINTSKGLTRETFDMRVGNSKVRGGGIMYNLSIPFSTDFEFYSFGGFNNKKGESAGVYRYPNAISGAVRTKVLAQYPNGFLPLINTDDLDLSGVIGIRGKISDWFVDFSQNFGQNTFDFNITNSANYSAIADTTGKFSSFQTQFDAGGMKFSQYTTNLDVSKKHDILEGLNTAFGAEYRIDGYDVRAGEEASYSNYNLKSGVAAGSQVYAGFLPQNAISKTRSSFAIYSDNELDITKKWLLAGALRFENYSDFGSTLNWKLATRYSLNNWLSVRASASTGFRAPSQQQKYFAKTSTLFIGSSSTPTEVGTLTNDSKAAQILGIPQLKQETSFSIAGGITARPTNNLEITLDAYRVKVNDRIILTNNFSSSFFTDPTVKDQLLQSGAQVVNFFTNAINTIASGVEGVINYDTKLGEGKLRATLSGSFINNEVEKDANGTAIIKGSDILTKNNQLPYYFNREDQSRLEVALPKDKVSFMLNYNINKLNFMVRATRFGAVTYLDSYYSASTNLYGDPTDPKNWAKNAFNNNTVETLDQVFSPKIVTDLTVSYKFVKAFTLAVGANNIFDVYQDVNANSTNMSAGRFIYSRRVQQMGFNGRYVFARLAFNFK